MQPGLESLRKYGKEEIFEQITPSLIRLPPGDPSDPLVQSQVLYPKDVDLSRYIQEVLDFAPYG